MDKPVKKQNWLNFRHHFLSLVYHLKSLQFSIIFQLKQINLLLSLFGNSELGTLAFQSQARKLHSKHKMGFRNFNLILDNPVPRVDSFYGSGSILSSGGTPTLPRRVGPEIDEFPG
jgi:hypothetical protein